MPFGFKPAASANDYVASLPPERKQAISAVRALIKKHLPKGYVESTQYGMISYVVPLSTYPDGYLGKKDVPLPYICLASQKQHMAVYLMCVYGDAKLSKWFTSAWKKTGKKLDMGKSCLRFKALDELALDVLGEAIGPGQGLRGPLREQSRRARFGEAEVCGQKEAGQKETARVTSRGLAWPHGPLRRLQGKPRKADRRRAARLGLGRDRASLQRALWRAEGQALVARWRHAHSRPA
jgi:hypothetical protein